MYNDLTQSLLYGCINLEVIFDQSQLVQVASLFTLFEAHSVIKQPSCYVCIHRLILIRFFRGNSMIEINQLQILGYLVLELNPVQEDPIHRGILDPHLDDVRVVHKLHKGLTYERLQGFKLELLIVKLRHCVVLQVDLVVLGLELVLEGTVGLASELVKHLSVHLRCVLEANEHSKETKSMNGVLDWISR